MFCFKQKSAYEMRISDWSSDVCSSDLLHRRITEDAMSHSLRDKLLDLGFKASAKPEPKPARNPDKRPDKRPGKRTAHTPAHAKENGRASCRERACQSV